MNNSANVSMQACGGVPQQQPTDEQDTSVKQHCKNASKENDGAEFSPARDFAEVMLNSHTDDCKSVVESMMETVTEKELSHKASEQIAAFFFEAGELLLKNESSTIDEVTYKINNNYGKVCSSNKSKGLKIFSYFEIKEIVTNVFQQLEQLKKGHLAADNKIKEIIVTILLNLIKKQQDFFSNPGSPEEEQEVSSALDKCRNKYPNLFVFASYLELELQIEPYKHMRDMKVEILCTVFEYKLEDPSLFIKEVKLYGKNAGNELEKSIKGSSQFPRLSKEILEGLAESIGCVFVGLKDTIVADDQATSSTANANQSATDDQTVAVQAPFSTADANQSATDHQTVNIEQNGSILALHPNFPEPGFLESLKQTEEESFIEIFHGSMRAGLPHESRINDDVRPMMKAMYDNLNNTPLSLNDFTKLEQFKKEYPMFYHEAFMICGNKNFSDKSEKVQEYLYMKLMFVSAKRLLLKHSGFLDIAVILFGQNNTPEQVAKILKEIAPHLQENEIATIVQMASEILSQLGSGFLRTPPIEDASQSATDQQTVNTEQNGSSSDSRLASQSGFPDPGNWESVKQTNEGYFAKNTAGGIVMEGVFRSQGKELLKLCLEIMDKNNPNLSPADCRLLEECKKKYPKAYFRACMLCRNENFFNDAKMLMEYIYEQLVFMNDQLLLVKNLDLFDEAFVLFGKNYRMVDVRGCLQSRGLTHEQANQTAILAQELYLRLGPGVLR